MVGEGKIERKYQGKDHAHVVAFFDAKGWHLDRFRVQVPALHVCFVGGVGGGCIPSCWSLLVTVGHAILKRAAFAKASIRFFACSRSIQVMRLWGDFRQFQGLDNVCDGVNVLSNLNALDCSIVQLLGKKMGRVYFIQIVFLRHIVGLKKWGKSVSTVIVRRFGVVCGQVVLAFLAGWQ